MVRRPGRIVHLGQMPRGDPTPELHPDRVALRQRALLLRIVRVGFFVLFATVTILAILDIGPAAEGTVAFGWISLSLDWILVLSTAVGLGVIVVMIDVLTRQRKISTLASIFFGLLVAMLAAVAVARVIDLIATVYDITAPGLLATTKVLVGICLAYLCITTVLQTQDDFRLVIPYVEFSKQLRGQRPMLLDSSALIDARIANLTRTGIIQAPLVIPAFVVAELQRLGDSGDRLKRAKGRRGLDIISRLQSEPSLDVSIDDTPVQAKAVDQMLVDLARSMQATVVTTDVGLSRVAEIAGVRVLNLNDVSNALKPALIPGQAVRIRLIKPGEQPGQAVGYLEDGTMVVAEDGAERIGRDVTLTVTSALQTSAGRLIFARLVTDDSEPTQDPGRPATGALPAVDAPPAPVVPQRAAPARDARAKPHPEPINPAREPANPVPRPPPTRGPRPPRPKGRNPRR